MATLIIKTPFNIELNFKLAPILKRGLAWMVDLFVLAIYNFLCYQLLNLMDSQFADMQQLQLDLVDNFHITIMLFLIMLPSFCYHFIIQYFWNGQSVGKYLLGIRVINADGGNTSLGQLMIRWILCLPNYLLLSLVFFLNINSIVVFLLAFFLFSIPDFVAIAISKKAQKLGDLAANTLVIESVYRADIKETFFEIHHDPHAYTVTFPDVVLLNDKDVNGLHTILKQANKSNEKYLMRIEKRIEEKTGIQNTRYTTKVFFELLIADYNFLTQQKGA